MRSIADPRPSCQGLALDSLLRFYADKGWKKPEEVKQAVKVYPSYGELLAAAKADGLEAVIIALPSHLHAAAALAALDAGLHVLVEPPMALTVFDAKKMARKAAEKKLCLAVGQQRHYSWIYDHALTMVEKDLLDQLHYIRAQWHLAKPEKGAGGVAAAKAAATDAEKKKAADEAKKYKLDWWQDVAKEDIAAAFDGYGSRDELLQWQLYEKYSGGLLAELGSQLFDAAAMFLAKTPNRDPQRPYPLSVAGAVLPDAEGCRGRHRRPRPLHLRVCHQGLRRCQGRAGEGPQEDRRAVRHDHRQRVRRPRRDGLGPQGLARAGKRTAADVLPHGGRG